VEIGIINGINERGIIMGKTALIAGATGLIGGELLQLALASGRYDQVTALVRKPMALTHSKLVQEVVDYEHLSEYSSIAQVDDVFCCLGTTIKVAKTKEAFEKVDKGYPLQLAQLAKEQDASQFLIVTAMGASSTSAVFYNRIKGETEEALKSMGLPALHIFRPSLLLGERNEYRLGERMGTVIAKALRFAMVGGLEKYRPIEAKAVARAMLYVAATQNGGQHTYASDEIAKLAER
jgi:uncharacterized protein YbjT (DUF2867 family)